MWCYFVFFVLDVFFYNYNGCIYFIYCNMDGEELCNMFIMLNMYGKELFLKYMWIVMYVYEFYYFKYYVIIINEFIFI